MRSSKILEPCVASSDAFVIVFLHLLPYDAAGGDAAFLR